MINNRLDITDRRDVARLVNISYDRIRADELLGPIFDDIAHVDWPTHFAAHLRLLGIGALWYGDLQGCAPRSAPRPRAAPAFDERRIQSVDFRSVSHASRWSVASPSAGFERAHEAGGWMDATRHPHRACVRRLSPSHERNRRPSRPRRGRSGRADLGQRTSVSAQRRDADRSRTCIGQPG